MKFKNRHGNRDALLIRRLEPRKCELCGKTAECRPYGPRGEWICIDCGKKDVATTERQMHRHLLGEPIQ